VVHPESLIRTAIPSSDFKTPIISDVGKKVPASTHRIAILFVLVAINIGDQKIEKPTEILKLNSLERKATNAL
jgi:hypothetical protein